MYDESGSIFNPISVSDYAAFANQQKQVVEEEAIERGLLSQAATRTQQCIRDLILLTPEVQENYTLDASRKRNPCVRSCIHYKGQRKEDVR